MEIRLHDVLPLPPREAVRADLAACHAMLADGSRTFLAASWLLPRAVRDPACALYAYCRRADDAVDRSDDPAAAVVQLRTELTALYRGAPSSAPSDRAFAAVARTWGIPPAVPAALLEGFEWDATGRRYETIEELHAYAARVAGTVGVMMSLLMDVRTPAALARACDLGVAMQLSNIARDVGEDARMGRLYLPRTWMREAGLDPDAWLAAPVFGPQLASVVRRLLDEADRLYARVASGVAELPLDCRPGINAARFLYAEIGHEVARRGLNSVDQRAVVSAQRKLAGLLRAATLLWPARVRPLQPALPACAFLVDAVQDWPRPRTPEAPWWSLAQRVIRIIEMFEQMGLRDRGVEVLR